MFKNRFLTVYALLIAVAVSWSFADRAHAADEREAKLIQLLQSDAPPKDKADSHSKCNTALMEHLSGGPVVEALSGSVVQLPSVAG